MKKEILILGLAGMLGCKGKETQKVPAGLVSPQKLTSILADFHIAEAQLETMQLNPDTAKVLFDRKQTEILKKRQVSQKDFDKTYDYYLNKNLIALDKLYEGLVDTLSLRELKYNNQTPPPATSPTNTSPAPETTTTKPDSAVNRKVLKNLKARRFKLK